MNEEGDINIGNNLNKVPRSSQSSTNDTSKELNDAENSHWSKYEMFFFIISYTVMFLTRLTKDLFKSVRNYFYPEHVIPAHILDLTQTSKELNLEKKSRKVPWIRHLTWINRIKFSLRQYLEAFKSYMTYSEDDRNFHFSRKVLLEKEKSYLLPVIPKEFCPKSLVIKTPTISLPSLESTLPSTSKNENNSLIKNEYIETDLTKAQNINIDFQPETIVLSDNEDDDSIVTAYLKEKDNKIDVEFLPTRKNISVLEKVPKMETIPEGEQFSAFRNQSLTSNIEFLPKCNDELSESSLDVHIPSFPGSPRSLNIGSEASLESSGHSLFAEAINFLHEDKEFLTAAETGNHKILEILIRKKTNIHQKDHLGRNALHLAVCSDSEAGIKLLLKTNINTNVKDNLGMTPLSLCLMRNPSYKIANLLFDHGAEIAPRSNPVDTGLFLQFVMMCEPTEEDVEILKLLVKKGAIVNDPEAPGGRQALHFAAMSNNCTLIRVLVDLGADLNLTNHRKETPKNVAQIFKCKEAYAMLSDLEEQYL